MRPRFGLPILVCVILAGCRTARPQITRGELVGSYAYKSEDPEGRATDHEWDHLSLQADGRYDLVQGGPTKPRSEETGTWRMVPWASAPDGELLLLNNSSFPIEVKKDGVRLLIDLDVGIWWAKAK